MVVASPVTRARKALLAVVLGAGLTAWAPDAGAQNVYSDQTLYGWATFDGSTGGSCYNSNSFTSYTGWGRRYYVVVKHGATHATSVSLSIDGQEWLGSSEFSSGADSVTRIIDLSHPTEGQTASHNLSICVTGPSGSSVSVRVYHLTEPTFVVYGQHTFNRLDPIADETTSFLNSYEATTPYLLRVINGAGDGSSRVTNAYLYLNNTGIFGPYDFGTGIATLTREVYLLGPVYNFEADYEDVVKGRNESSTGTFFKAEIRGTDASAPWLTVTSSSPTDGLITEASSVAVAGSALDDQTKVLVTVSDSTTGVANTPVRGNGSFSDAFGMSADREYTLKIVAENSAGLASSTVYRHVTRDQLAPVLTVDRPAASFAPVESTTIALKVSWADTTHTTITVDGDTVASGKYGTYTTAAYPLDLGPNRIVFRAVDAIGHATTVTRLVFRNASESTPPTLSASTIALTEIPPFLSQVRFLYAGSPPLQTGPGLDTMKFQPGLAAVVRGKVGARDFGGLQNVAVRILDHPEYGQTLTRADGQFDMVVNGGGPLTLRFLKTGYLEAQRQVDVPINDYLVLDSLALIGQSSKHYVIKTDSLRVLVGRFETDLNGDRKLTMLFAPGTVCSVTTAAGNTTTYTNFQVRLKEFTVGSGGAEAMPAQLPPSSAYTYCVDMGVVEADALTGLGDAPPVVRFDRPIVTYVKNFLGIPATVTGGTRMPSGYYDPRAGKWVATEDGVVVRVLQDSSGYAKLDTDGDGSADAASRYASLGIDLAERAEVKKRFAVGDSLWRTRIDHFSARDLNENEAPQAQAEAFNATRASVPAPFIDDPTPTCGCVIENENRILGESIPIAGTPFALNYRSNRQPGDKAMRFIRVPLTGPSPQAGLRQVTVLVDIAGRRFKYQKAYNPNNPPPANESWLCDQWDGTDAYGRRLPGSTTATVRIGYEFVPRYQMAAMNGSGSFGSPSGAGTNGGTAASYDRDRSVVRWTTQKVSVGAPSMASAALGGWTISPHAFYDTNGRGTVYYGDGSARLGNRQFPTLKVWAGNGASASSPIGGLRPQDGNAATTGSVMPEDIAVGPDGSIYLTDAGHHVISKISPDGKYQVISGTGTQGVFDPANDNGQNALLVKNYAPGGITVADNGDVYFAETVTGQERVLRVSDGKIWLFAGIHGGSFAEDSLATTIPLPGLRSVAIAPDGAVFLGTSHRIIRVGPNGRARTYAGWQDQSHFNTGCPGGAGRADSLSIDGAEDMVCDANGNLYFTELTHDRVRKVSPDGRLADYVCQSGFAPRSLAIGPDGALYIAQDNAAQENVVRAERDGTLSLVAGGLNASGRFLEQDGEFAVASTFASVRSIALGADGALYVGEVATGNDANGIHKVTADLPGQSPTEIAYPSRDGSTVDYFTLRGQHLSTVDGVTGIVRYRFGYDAGGRLIKIYDARGDSTVINRDGSGNPTSIVAPYGQTTSLGLTGGYLSSATIAGSLSYSLTYYADSPGLLHTFTNPRGRTWTYGYDTVDGRLETDLDPAGETMSFSQQESGIARTVTRTSPEQMLTKFNIHQLMNGIYRRFEEQADGSHTSFVDSMSLQPPYGQVIRSAGSAGETVTRHTARDFRFGWFAPVDSVTDVLLPSGLPDTMTITSTRLSAAPRYFESVAFNGKRFVASYDSSERVIRSVSPLGRVWTVTLNAQGWLTGYQWGSLEPVSLGYDARGKVTHVGQGWRALAYTYDGSGRLQTVTDTLGRTTSFTYDAADRETVVTLPGNREVHLAYDGNGNVTRITPPGSAAHSFTYTGLDRDSTYTPPGIAGVSDPATKYEYNGDRQLLRIVRPDTVVGLEYDTYGRLSNIYHTQGTNTLTYTSPSTGQVRSLTAADGTVVTEDYDGPLLKKETWSGPVAGSVERTFNQWFRDSTQKVNGANEVTFTYDSDGLITGAGSLFIHRRGDDGLIDSTQAGAVSSSATYNNFGEIMELHYTVADTTFFHQQLFRDELGRIIRIHETVDGQTHERVYRYDITGRLDSVAVDSAHVAAYRYDNENPGNGNRTAVTDASGDTVLTADYDAQDRLLRYGFTAYGYTDNGDLRTKIDSSGTTQFLYDPLGNLVRVKTPDDHQIDYLVDGMNRRVGYKVDGILQRVWLYEDALRPVAELDRAGDVVSRLVYGTYGQAPDLLLRNTDEYRIVTDYLGSVRAVVNMEDGTVAQRLDYDSWGARTSDTAPGFQPLGFASGLTDTAFALVRFGARDYDPWVGRWAKKDPMQFRGGLNLYAYVHGSPINYVDPSGLDATKYQGMHHYKCNQVMQLLQWAREDAGGPYGWYLGIQNHGPKGYLDVSQYEPGSSFDVPGFDKPLSPEEFGNFIAGYAGYYQGGATGLEGVLIAGKIFDLFNDWPGPFSNDVESQPMIRAGYMYAMEGGRNARCGCP